MTSQHSEWGRVSRDSKPTDDVSLWKETDDQSPDLSPEKIKVVSNMFTNEDTTLP